MKIMLYFFAVTFVLTTFNIFQIDNDTFSFNQEQLKHVADDCSAAAMLYYEEEPFSEGVKIFDKTAGNDAVEYIIGHDLKEYPENYYVYYFDGNGKMSKYKGKRLIAEEEGISYPYMFCEALTGYQSLVNEPRVIVTLDCGEFDYRLNYITDPKLIRTSGYEYVGG